MIASDPFPIPFPVLTGPKPVTITPKTGGVPVRVRVGFYYLFSGRIPFRADLPVAVWAFHG